MSWANFLISIRESHPLMFAEYTKKTPQQFQPLPEQKKGKKK